jgi:integrase
MKGSIYFRKDRGNWVVQWWHREHNKKYLITRYRGELMYHRKIAEKCLATIQGDYEQHQQGLVSFRMEKYTGKGWTDIIEYFQDWMENVIEPKRKPATVKGYWSYFNNWIKPFFKENPIMLHEVQLDTLNKLLNYIDLQPKGKYNVINCLHSFFDYAWRSKRIPEIPPFPKKEDYNLETPVIKWLPEDRQMKIIEAIPEQDRPIFLFLKYHLRRPSEACVLRWMDFDEINQVFIIRRTLSARKVVERTKTGAIHNIPCHPDFMPVLKSIPRQDGTAHIFVNPLSRHKEKRYTNESLNRIWRKACQDTGENIDLYSGLKHSSASQYINEKGLSFEDVKTITDHANIESVKRYAKTEVETVRRLMATTKLLPDDKKVRKLHE